MTTETLTKPKLGDPCDQWPPVQHIIRKEDQPAREGTIALCGAKLMGIDLGSLRDARGKVCGKCVEAFRREAGL